ncbi:hypothetical protein UFOVP62_42 [uncultured Caudovirales phage]|uniref:Uncharacterized protein n=1 Tax=uncultured Caudovirales phage TaxID=2100421 RepID=A0A6J5KXG2_9CAUD|nr:hypothetical protein UFOVP62_42 [uncultured Caudovirales phage]
MNPTSPARTCATCLYFAHEDGPYGQCHFQPPAPIWAKVSPRDWCGQHDPIKTAPRASKAQQSPSTDYVRGTMDPLPLKRKGGAA